MPTHYDVLGVNPGATADEIRQAFRARARQLHPDRALAGEGAASARAMQEVNEAWRVLGDPARRAAYDRRLVRPAERAPHPSPPRAWPFDPEVHPFDPDVDLDPRPYHAPVPRDDIGSQVVRSLPWAAAAVVLGAIFVITALAGTGSDDRPQLYDLVGRCVAEREGAEAVAVPCDQPNEGRVDLVTSRASHCPSGSTALGVRGGERWLCLRAVDG